MSKFVSGKLCIGHNYTGVCRFSGVPIYYALRKVSPDEVLGDRNTFVIIVVVIIVAVLVVVIFGLLYSYSACYNPNG